VKYECASTAIAWLLAYAKVLESLKLLRYFAQRLGKASVLFQHMADGFELHALRDLASLAQIARCNGLILYSITAQ
jgi:hypothetical protein